MIHYSTIFGISVIALLILLSNILRSDLTTNRIKRFFSLAILATIMVILAEVMTMYFEYATTSRLLPHIIGNILGFSLSPLIPLFIGYAIDYDNKKRVFLFWIPAVINFFLAILSIKYPIIFGISNANIYFRGNFFWIYIISYGVGITFLFIRTLTLVNRYQNKNRLVLLSIFLFLVFGTSIQIMTPELHVSWLCISMAICLYYIYCCELSYHIDGLTGLLGYRAYEKYITKISKSPKATVLFFDIDNFKIVNDTYGHQFGDYCLTTVSACIKNVFFKIGLCFRIGGDEFCVISNKTDEAEIQKAYHEFLTAIESMRKIEKNFPMVSIGCAHYDKEKGSIHDAILQADKEMYHFKDQRKKGEPYTG